MCLFCQKGVADDFRTAYEERVRVAVGFRHVIDLLVSHKKLVVGHNCFLGDFLKLL